MPSFDIVSETDLNEVDNAIAGMQREIATRYDFKGSKCSIERKEAVLTIVADDDLKLRQMHELLSTYLRSEEHTSELQSLMRISYAVFCLKKKTHTITEKKTSTK